MDKRQLPDYWSIEHLPNGAIKIIPSDAPSNGCFRSWFVFLAVPFGIATLLGYYEFFFHDLPFVNWGENRSDARPNLWLLIGFTFISGFLWYCQILSWFQREEWRINKNFFEVRHTLFGYTKIKVIRDGNFTVEYTVASDARDSNNPEVVGYHLKLNESHDWHRLFGSDSLEEVRGVGIYLSEITSWPLNAPDVA